MKKIMKHQYILLNNTTSLNVPYFFIAILLVYLILTSCALKNHDYLLHRGIHEYRLKKYYSSISYLSRFLSFNHENKIAYLYRGHAFSEVGKSDMAFSDYYKAIEIDKNYKDAYFAMGVLYGELEDFEKSIENYNKVILLDKEHLPAYINRGWMYLSLLRGEDAKKDFEKVLGNDNTNIYALSGISKYYLNRDNLYALEYINRAISINKFSSYLANQSDDLTLYVIRGEIYSEMNRCDLAIHDFTKVIKDNKKDTDIYDVYIKRADCFSRNNDKENAIIDYSHAIRINRNNVTAYNNRAYTFFELKRYQDALRDFNTALKIEPRNAEILYNRSTLFYKLNMYIYSFNDISKSMEIEPKNNKYKEWYKEVSGKLKRVHLQ